MKLNNILIIPMLTFILPLLVDAQGAYGIIGLRNNNYTNPLTLDFVKGGFSQPYDAEAVYSNVREKTQSTILGFGFQWEKPEKIYGGMAYSVSKLYISYDLNSFDITKETIWSEDTKLEYDITVGNTDISVGGGYGLKLLNGLMLTGNIEYTFTGGNDYNHEFKMPSKNYISLNISVGYSKRSKLGHLGVYSAHHPKRYFINKQGPTLTSNDIVAEIPIRLVLLGGLCLGVAASNHTVDPLILPKGNSNNVNPNSSPGQSFTSQIEGEFTGWNGQTVVMLTNGQVWQQSEYYYYYHYAYMPEVHVYLSNSGYKMSVAGVQKDVSVVLLK